jgi:hypothetical protein
MCRTTKVCISIPRRTTSHREEYITINCSIGW